MDPRGHDFDSQGVPLVGGNDGNFVEKDPLVV